MTAGKLAGWSAVAGAVAGAVVGAAQAVAGAVVCARLARGRRRRPPLRPVPAVAESGGSLVVPAGEVSVRATAGNVSVVVPAGNVSVVVPAGNVSVVVPARDEEGRLGPCVAAALADPAVREVIVVDDESTDGTARLAASLGATVVRGTPPPPGWVGKPWAVHQGLAAAKGPVVVTLDADARPRPGLFGALAAGLEEFDLVSAGPRFACDGPVEQALHASFLATLVYRLGPIGAATPPPPHRVLANGQCLAFHRSAMLAADGFARVREHLADDVALARTLAADGWRVGLLDAGDLLTVDMHDSVAGVWREWGRTLALADVTGRGRQAADLAVVWLTAALPVARLLAGRATPLDLGLLGVRLLLAWALRGSYERPGPGLLLSPLLDPATAVQLTRATYRPRRIWRGRSYGPPRPLGPLLGGGTSGGTADGTGGETDLGSGGTCDRTDGGTGGER
ncbi:glycosyltransferase [Nonomuraea roseoviolacea]|uniref:Dolichol-phosphate mannosyltransferase n=1 Tax=Nonomuraea roseoviolacea subsp. carminata TaxID=160689 RepID=A0ABT1K7E2_9ACTN|nr:glycosyltransferase [Nonomuraea roseoviolacea]MCP2349893.1 dolichol-phosphate mannosyltransferase [Nonomuraea roseoviolacea subsp. carminata]